MLHGYVFLGEKKGGNEKTASSYWDKQISCNVGYKTNTHKH